VEDGAVYIDVIFHNDAPSVCNCEAPDVVHHGKRKVQFRYVDVRRKPAFLRLIMNYFDNRYTNAYVEAVNGLFDQISRAGLGYDFETLRSKALLRYGRLTAPDATFDVTTAESDEERVTESTFQPFWRIRSGIGFGGRLTSDDGEPLLWATIR
jgi:hypothetical protein